LLAKTRPFIAAEQGLAIYKDTEQGFLTANVVMARHIRNLGPATRGTRCTGTPLAKN
jgi:hypothetical protein